MSDILQVEVRDQLGIIWLSRLDALNALNAEFLTQLLDAVNELEAEPDVRVAVFASKHPKAFVAGADIKAMQDMTALQRTRFSEYGHQLMSAIENSKIVFIAAVNGFCLGGGFELTLSCDLIAGGDKAMFAFPEIGLGIIPGFGGTQRFTRSAGMHRSLAFALTGDRFGLAEAQQFGLIWKSFAADDTDAFNELVLEAATKLSQQAPLAMENIKRLVRQATYTDLNTGGRLEIQAFGTIGASEDTNEGLSAFLEKRTPKFTGK